MGEHMLWTHDTLYHPAAQAADMQAQQQPDTGHCPAVGYISHFSDASAAWKH
jgi:hypothetical protein